MNEEEKRIAFTLRTYREQCVLLQKAVNGDENSKVELRKTYDREVEAICAKLHREKADRAEIKILANIAWEEALFTLECVEDAASQMMLHRSGGLPKILSLEGLFAVRVMQYWEGIFDRACAR